MRTSSVNRIWSGRESAWVEAATRTSPSREGHLAPRAGDAHVNENFVVTLLTVNTSCLPHPRAFSPSRLAFSVDLLIRPDRILRVQWANHARE